MDPTQPSATNSISQLTHTTPSPFPFTPPFTKNIHTWLTHTEATWVGLNITDDAKFQAIVRALPSDVYATIAPAIATSTTGRRYNDLKTALTAAFGQTTRQQLQALEGVQSEGRRPSELLRHMLRLNADAGNPLSEQLLRMRHTKLMPHSVQMLLLSRPNTSLQEYGELADTLTEAAFDHVNAAPASPRNNHHNDSSPLTAQPPPGTTTLLLQRVQDLSEQVRQLQQSQRPSWRPTTTHWDHQMAPAPRNQRQEVPPRNVRDRFQQSQSSFCFYHQQFGPQARNCRPPCSWAISESASQPAARQGNW